MDETRKAVSVGQLQELHAGYDQRLKTVEAGAKSQGDTSATMAALAAQMVVLQQTVAECKQMCAQMMAQEPAPPPDFSPILAAIQVQGDQIAALAAAIAGLTQIVLRPLTRTGEARLPDGGLIQLQVSETRN